MGNNPWRVYSRHLMFSRIQNETLLQEVRSKVAIAWYVACMEPIFPLFSVIFFVIIITGE